MPKIKYKDSDALLSTGTHPFASERTVTSNWLWSFFAPKIAGRGSYRWMNAEGKYLPSNERKISEESPARPAAVMLYSADGYTRTLCLDFDSKHPSLEDDLVACQALLDSLDVLYVVDQSISGGRHVYIPLTEELSCIDVRPFIDSLGTLWNSLDPSPHRVAKHGCIRVPGSRHKRGGYQELVTEPDRAVAVFSLRNTPTVISRFLETCKELTEATKKTPLVVSTATSMPRRHPDAATTRTSSPLRRPTSFARAIADGAPFEGAYATPSEARMAVICSLVASGWDSYQIQSDMASGRFPGLSALYAKYTTRAQEHRLQVEVSKAQAFVEKRQSSYGNRGVRKNNMNGTFNSQRGDTHGEIRKMRALIDIFDQRMSRSRSGIYLRVLVRALFEFAHKTGQLKFAVGCRALAIATGMHYATVSKLLKELVSIPGSPISKTKKGYLGEADEYELRLDMADRLIAHDRRLASGKIYAIRPVFRALGPVAALVYESIERTPHQSRRDLARSTGLSGTAVYESLKEMDSLGMVYLDHGEWRIRVSANLRRLADSLGVLDEMTNQISRYRTERKQWHEYLASVPGSRYYQEPLGEQELFDPATDETTDDPPLSYRFVDAQRPLEEHELYDAEMEQYWIYLSELGDTSLVDISLLQPYSRVAV